MSLLTLFNYNQKAPISYHLRDRSRLKGVEIYNVGDPLLKKKDI
jgi:hypothetical protein